MRMAIAQGPGPTPAITNGAAHITTQAGSVNAYGDYPARDWDESSGTGSAAGVFLTKAGLEPYGKHTIHNTGANAITVEITLDGTTWLAGVVVGSLITASVGYTLVASIPGSGTTADGGVLDMKVAGIRLSQTGAGTSGATIVSYS